MGLGFLHFHESRKWRLIRSGPCRPRHIFVRKVVIIYAVHKGEQVAVTFVVLVLDDFKRRPIFIGAFQEVNVQIGFLGDLWPVVDYRSAETSFKSGWCCSREGQSLLTPFSSKSSLVLLRRRTLRQGETSLHQNSCPRHRRRDFRLCVKVIKTVVFVPFAVAAS